MLNKSPQSPETPTPSTSRAEGAANQLWLQLVDENFCDGDEEKEKLLNLAVDHLFRPIFLLIFEFEGWVDKETFSDQSKEILKQAIGNVRDNFVKYFPEAISNERLDLGEMIRKMIPLTCSPGESVVIWREQVGKFTEEILKVVASVTNSDYLFTAATIKYKSALKKLRS